MNMVPADELEDHVRCMIWLRHETERSHLVDEYLVKVGDMSIHQYIKIMHPEVWVEWRMSR